jgi:hypothetical protein
VNWYITKGTFNRTRFLDAFKATVVSAVYQRHPCCPRRCCGGRRRRDSPTLFDARSCRTPNPSRASVPSSSWTTPPSIIALSSSHYVTRRALFFCTRHPTASTAHPWTMERLAGSSATCRRRQAHLHIPASSWHSTWPSGVCAHGMPVPFLGTVNTCSIGDVTRHCWFESCIQN